MADRNMVRELMGDDGEVVHYESRLRHNILKMPPEIKEASGIIVNGRKIRSLLFTTDVALVHNCDADAVFAVYPFTAHRSISSAIIHMASVPVFCGVGGGTTQGTRAVYLAIDAESQGATGVVVNAPFPNNDLRLVARALDIPIVVTVTDIATNIAQRIRHGADILHVAGGPNTNDIVQKIRKSFPKVPIIATGGKTSESIRATIAAGANAIVYSPPSSAELFRAMMDTYRH